MGVDPSATPFELAAVILSIPWDRAGGIQSGSSSASGLLNRGQPNNTDSVALYREVLALVPLYPVFVSRSLHFDHGRYSLAGN
jgi:hypothetical protein